MYVCTKQSEDEIHEAEKRQEDAMDRVIAMRSQGKHAASRRFRGAVVENLISFAKCVLFITNSTPCGHPQLIIVFACSLLLLLCTSLIFFVPVRLCGRDRLHWCQTQSIIYDICVTHLEM